MKELEYPFVYSDLFRNKKKIRRELLKREDLIDKKIAVLGGSTTSEVKNYLELFLLDNGIRPSFYESEYNKYFEDAVFGNEQLNSFSPDIVVIFTSFRNLNDVPSVKDSDQQIAYMLASETSRYQQIWEKVEERFHCTIIQNNFELPPYRLLGNRDSVDRHGLTNYIKHLNAFFDEYAEKHEWLHINDINYVSACYGLDKWYDETFYDMYKYAMCMEGIVDTAFNLSRIIKAIYGKNKKALVLDMDNTLWGGVIGDDGVDHIVIGKETGLGEAYTSFQQYVKKHKDLGVLLAVDSKNDMGNALAGLNHPSSVLKKDDFVEIKANWQPKNTNIQEISHDLNLLPDSFVFVDDNPAERDIVQQSFPGIAAPDIGSVEDYIRILDHNGYFEVVSLSQDDLKRNEMYQANAKRMELQKSFGSYEDYLKSLKMTAEVRSFIPEYCPRIAQLSNKSNQFNVTTRRYSQEEIEEIMKNPDYIALYGKLSDRFGDNGVVSVVIGKIERDILDLQLWIMSCRVLKRDFEYVMLNEVVREAEKHGIKKIIGHFYPTKKNHMVADLFENFGFHKIHEDQEGNTEWELNVSDYQERKTEIEVLK